jgi:steroid delta-isomerase-like uncharacterized protein
MTVSAAGSAAAVRAAREALVREHIASEEAHDFRTTLGTFSHPRYEIIPTGQVFDGPDEVMGYFQSSREAFPDQHPENVRLHHTDDAVVAECDLVGTHLGPLLGLPATGRGFRCPTVIFFFFDRDRIRCERVYFDLATVLTQLGLTGLPVTPTG